MLNSHRISMGGLLLITLTLTPSLTAQLSHKKDYIYSGPRVLAVESQGCIVEDASCNVGMGAATPAAPLHVWRDDGTARILVEEADPAPTYRQLLTLDGGGLQTVIRMNNSDSAQWEFAVKGSPTSRFEINKIGSANPFKFESNGDLEIIGDLTVHDIYCEACDRVFQPDYLLPTIEDHAAAMFGNSYLPAIGPTPDEDPGPIQVGDKLLRMLNELETAHIYIDQLNNRLKTEEQRAAALDEHFVAGRFLDASSRDRKQNIAELSAEEAKETVLALSPVRFAYTEEPSEEHLGFIAEDVPDLVATADRKKLSTMDVVAVLTKTVQEQQHLLDEKDSQLRALEQRMARLEQLLAADSEAPPQKGIKAAD